jgi:IclR family KDG regulon transcriptional repressor
MPTEKAQSLQRVVAILDCFTLERPRLGVREVARKVNLSHSAAGRLMQALRELGILSQDSDTALYSMGARVLTWAGMYSNTLDVRNAALPAMRELHQRTMETISLYILDGAERVCVERLESPQSVRIVAYIGRRLPLHAGSAGKVFLAFMPPARRDEILKSHALTPLTLNTIVDLQALLAECDTIRSQGYAVSQGEWILEASGVAVPIFDSFGSVTAALSISGPAQRFTAAKIAEYILEITRVGQQISRSMGYRGLMNHFPQIFPTAQRVAPGV